MRTLYQLASHIDPEDGAPAIGDCRVDDGSGYNILWEAGGGVRPMTLLERELWPMLEKAVDEILVLRASLIQAGESVPSPAAAQPE